MPTSGRLFPRRIQATHVAPAGTALLDWAYTTDAVGNPTAITDSLSPAASRAFGYVDTHYFLRQASGPWGALAWTYDEIGNRLSETRDGETASYAYFTNPAGGHLPKLNTITPPAPAPTTYFTFDAAGNQSSERG